MAGMPGFRLRGHLPLVLYMLLTLSSVIAPLVTGH